MGSGAGRIAGRQISIDLAGLGVGAV